MKQVIKSPIGQDTTRTSIHPSAPQHDWQHNLRSKELAQCLPSAIRQQYRTSIDHLEWWAWVQPGSLLQKFEESLKSLDQLHLVGRLLREEGFPIPDTYGPSAEDWYEQTSHEIFGALTDRAKAILLAQGLKL